MTLKVADNVLIEIGRKFHSGVVWQITQSCKPYLIKYFDEEADEWCTAYADDSNVFKCF